MNNNLVFDDSYTFHTNIYCDVFNFMKNVLNRAKIGTCATTGTFTLSGQKNILTLLLSQLRLFVSTYFCSLIKHLKKLFINI